MPRQQQASGINFLSSSSVPALLLYNCDGRRSLLALDQEACRSPTFMRD